jgi:hypothetical protein
LGVARAIVEGAGIMDATARRRKRADEVTKLRPSICVAHCSGVRVVWVWPKGVIASYLEVAIFRTECGDVIALENALNAASDVKSLCFCQGGYRGVLGRKGGGWRRSLGCRMGQLRKEEVLCWLRLC